MSRLIPALLAFVAGVALTGGAWALVANEVIPLPDLAPTYGGGDDGPDGRQHAEPRTKATELELLQALGYVDAAPTEDPDASGVVEHDRESASPGLNLYASRKEDAAHLVDMDGDEVHTWRVPGESWQHVELLDDGGLLVLIKDQELLRIDRDSDVQWRHLGRFHHDMAVAPDGRIYALTRHAEIREQVHPRVPTLVDTVTILDMDGREIERVDLLAALRASPYAFLLPALADRTIERDDPLDILHTNHIEVFDGALADLDPIYAEGNWLISMRNVNAIFIVDGDSHEVIWAWGPTNVMLQHHPTLLPDGHLLVFDNGDRESQVVELDPLSRQVVWRYADGRRFYTETRGSNQRLPNGNTLITESDSGEVFEVTPRGEVVWRWLNPDVDDKGRRAALFRMQRFDPQDLDWLDTE